MKPIYYPLLVWFLTHPNPIVRHAAEVLLDFLGYF